MTYPLAMGFTKVSICSTLLRLNKGTSHWKTTWALWLITIVVTATSTGSFLYYVTRCDPSNACRDSVDTLRVLTSLWGGLYIIIDIALAVVPLFIIRGLNMKKSLKMSLGVILAMGGIACLASILRIPARLDIDGGGTDRGYVFGSSVLWGVVETGLSIIACCLPMLRKLLTSFDKEDIIGRPGYYNPDSPGQSRESPGNKIQRLPHDSCILPRQEKRLNAV